MSLLKFYYPPADSPNPQRRYTSFEDYMTRYDPDGLKKWVEQRLHGSPQLVYQPTPQGWSELTTYADQVRAAVYARMDEALHQIDPLIDLKPRQDDDDE